MLGVGFTELVVIGLVALVVVGPEELPRLMRQAGRWYGQARRTADDLRRAFMLEADRQEAAERYAKLQERRRQLTEERARATASGAAAQPATLPGVEAAETPPVLAPPAPGHGDPEDPAPVRAETR